MVNVGPQVTLALAFSWSLCVRTLEAFPGGCRCLRLALGLTRSDRGVVDVRTLPSLCVYMFLVMPFGLKGPGIVGQLARENYFSFLIAV